MKFLLCIAGGLLAATSYAQISVVKLDINPLGRSNAMSYTSFNGKTYFIGKSNPVGTELWWSDGMNFGLVADINPGPVNGIYPDPLYGINLCVVGNELYFPATDGPHGTQIWVYDGVSAPKMAINQGVGGMERSHLTELNGELYFKATIPSAVGKTRVYRYTPATQVCAEISPTLDVRLTEPMAVVNGKLVTPGSLNGGPVELQVYDPMTGIVSTEDVNSEPAPSNPVAFYTHDNVLYFQATSTAYGSELYSYNASSAPSRLTDIMP
ncbi:MAG: hypothetical protein K0R82_3076, partial [Flavipsychrobacter sp.]|nr:hypothetical protein [Flavipsychrobacter sp.]